MKELLGPEKPIYFEDGVEPEFLTPSGKLNFIQLN